LIDTFVVEYWGKCRSNRSGT